MLGEVLTASRQGLQRLADQSVLPGERVELMDILGQLVRGQAILQDAFPRMMREEVLRAIDGSGKGGGGLSFGSLELMDSEQVQENVETARAQQAATNAVEGELAQLNSLICSAQGLPRVQMDRNPLRPEVYMRSLRRAMGETKAPVKSRMRWMQVFGEHFGPHLAKVYDELSDLLRAQGVGAASFRVITQPTSSVRPGAPAPAAGGGPVGTGTGVRQAAAPRAAFGFDVEAPAAPAAPAARQREPEFQATDPGGLPLLDLPPIHLDETGAAVPQGAVSDADGKLLTLARLHELLAGQVAPDASAGGAAAAPQPDFQMTMPAAFETLEEMGEVEEMVQRVAFRSFQIDDGSGQSAPAQVVQARNTSQALALEVVQIMLEQLASDDRLLPSVRAAIAQLRPALLRLAVADPRFFSDKQHPARALLDRITQNSLAWTHEEDATFQVYLGAVRHAVGVVCDSKVEGAEPFTFALESLDDALRDAQRRDQRKRESEARAFSHMTQRQRLADEIGDELVKRARQAGVPRSIALFLRGPWAHVIAEARLLGQGSQTDPKAFEDVVTDLLWTTKVGAAGGQVARLASVVPGLTATVRGGLEFIRYAPNKLELFMQELAALHQSALLSANSGAAAPAAVARPLLDSQLHDGLWMEESGLMQMDFEDTAPPTEMMPMFEDTAPHEWSQEDETAAAPGGLGNALTAGAWVEVQAEGRWLRWRCEGASDDGAGYRFTDANGGEAVLTAAQLGRLRAQGQLRVVAQQGMVDGALDAVAEIALRNSASNT